VVKALDERSLSRSARHDWISCCIQDQLGLLKGMLLTEVPQELQEPEIPRQIRLRPRSTRRSGLSKENRYYLDSADVTATVVAYVNGNNTQHKEAGYGRHRSRPCWTGSFGVA
jgi:hypothetical protein